MARLGDVCNIINGYAFRSEQYVDEGIRIIRIANVQKGYIEDSSPVFYSYDSKDAQKYILEENDILMSLTGNVGRVAKLSKEFLPAALNQRVACLRIKDGVKLDKAFLFNLLNSDYFEQQCIAASKGVAQKNMSTEWLKEYEIPMLTIEQQSAIANILNNVSEQILLRKQQLAKLDELVKSQFVEMFGDKNYPMVCLSDVADISSGLTKNANRPSFPVKMPYLRVANVFFNRLDLSDVQEIGLQEKEVEKTLLMKDDLLFVEGNGSPEQIGRVALWDGSIAPISHQNHIIKARFSSSLIIPGFAMYYFMLPAGREQILESAVSTSGLYTLSVGKISNFKLPMPPKDEQEVFMTIVAQSDKSKLSIQQSIDQLETLKASLMQKYFG